MDVALKLVSVRADISLNIISSLTSALGGTKNNAYREMAIKITNDFKYKNLDIEKGSVLEKILSDEKQHVLSLLDSVALPGLNQ